MAGRCTMPRVPEMGTTPRSWRGDWDPLPMSMLDGIWVAERVRRQVPLRSVAIRLADGQLAVYSPINGLGADAHRALAARGRVGCLISPNHFHHLGLAEYAAAHAPVLVVGSPTAVPRVARKSGLAIGDESGLRAALPSHVSLLLPPGTRNGELWLSVAVPGGRAWIVGDAFFNIPRTPISPIGLILRSLGILPGLRVGTTFRVLVRDPRAYRAWVLDRIHSERPTVLVPCHGDVIQDEALPERLQRLMERRFRV